MSMQRDNYIKGEISVLSGKKLSTPLESSRRNITPMITNRIKDSEINRKMPKVLACSALQNYPIKIIKPVESRFTTNRVSTIDNEKSSPFKKITKGAVMDFHLTMR